jgi:hypothetical protein
MDATARRIARAENSVIRAGRMYVVIERVVVMVAQRNILRLLTCPWNAVLKRAAS